MSGYGNIKNWIKGNPKVNKDYFCKFCGDFSDIYDKPNWQDLVKNNVCKKCVNKKNSENML